MHRITVIGGGFAGLTAAITAAEAGVKVTLHEAHHTLGGRARTAEGPYRTNEGPHALYSGGPHWAWLKQRDLIGPLAPIPPLEGARLRLRHHGVLRRTPPFSMLKLLRRSARQAPVDVDFLTWATGIAGEEGARAAAHYCAVALFHHDPGSLSAAFVLERLRRATKLPPEAQYPRGGWAGLIDRMAARAWNLGVRMETLSRVDALPTGTPVIVATTLDAARRLLGDGSLTWPSGRTPSSTWPCARGAGTPSRSPTWTRPAGSSGSPPRTAAWPRPASSSSRVRSPSPRTSPRPTAPPAPNSCSTWGSRAGASGSPGGAIPSRPAVRARSTCPAPAGVTGPPWTGATVSTWPATRSRPPAYSRRSPSTAP